MKPISALFISALLASVVRVTWPLLVTSLMTWQAASRTAFS